MGARVHVCRGFEVLGGLYLWESPTWAGGGGPVVFRILGVTWGCGGKEIAMG
jgi:hypothetical protein